MAADTHPTDTPAENSPGVRCPKCHSGYSKVVYTRRYPKRVMRRRECRNPHCQTRFYTTERVGVGS